MLKLLLLIDSLQKC